MRSHEGPSQHPTCIHGPLHFSTLGLQLSAPRFPFLEAFTGLQSELHPPMVKAKVPRDRESQEQPSANNSWWMSGSVSSTLAPGFYSRMELQAPAMGTTLLFLSYLFFSVHFLS